MDSILPGVRLLKLVSMESDVGGRIHLHLESGVVGFLDAAFISDEIKRALEFAIQFDVPVPVFDAAGGHDERNLNGRIGLNSAPFDRGRGTVGFIESDRRPNQCLVSILPSPRIFTLPENSRTFQDDLSLLQMAAKNHDDVWIFIPNGTWEIYAVRRC